MRQPENASRDARHYNLVTWQGYEHEPSPNHFAAFRSLRFFHQYSLGAQHIPFHIPASEALNRDAEQRKHACSNKRNADQGAPLRAASDESRADIARDQPDGGLVRAAAVRPARYAGVRGAGRGQVSASDALLGASAGCWESADRGLFRAGL